ncbi:MAG: MBOAT family protein [Clostridia bacterium]|nr:MBOAT family protein [Clostridia bacterium]
MLFSSIPFLFYFLPITIFLYFICPKVLKNALLAIVSFIFYAWGEPRYVVIMIVAVAASYLFGLLTELHRGKWLSKLWLILALAVGFGMLCYFKYADFFISNFNGITGLSVPLLNVALPIGISFYTFQLTSYNIDVYRGDTKAQKNPIDLAAYISFFPQLIAGPIVRYTDIEKQLKHRTHTFEKIAYGSRRFIIGLSKKILIANALGELCDIFKATNDNSILFFWLYGIAFSLHIYFDFSGYSDMAIGLGSIFGFEFIENFNYPYISRSVTEFWRRWHMSLGSWFRDYVYIPLGGNRVSKLKFIRNIFIVWMFTGFWHGAAWNFIAWGLFFAVFLLLEKFLLKKLLDKSHIISRVYLLFLVMVSFILFNATDMKDAIITIGGLFGYGGHPIISTEFIYYLRSFAVIIVIAAIGATSLPKMLTLKLMGSKVKIISYLEPVFLALLLIMCTAYLVDGSFNPFLYFRF